MEWLFDQAWLAMLECFLTFLRLLKCSFFLVWEHLPATPMLFLEESEQGILLNITFAQSYKGCLNMEDGNCCQKSFKRYAYHADILFLRSILMRFLVRPFTERRQPKPRCMHVWLRGPFKNIETISSGWGLGTLGETVIHISFPGFLGS